MICWTSLSSLYPPGWSLLFNTTSWSNGLWSFAFSLVQVFTFELKSFQFKVILVEWGPRLGNSQLSRPCPCLPVCCPVSSFLLINRSSISRVAATALPLAGRSTNQKSGSLLKGAASWSNWGQRGAVAGVSTNNIHVYLSGGCHRGAGTYTCIFVLRPVTEGCLPDVDATLALLHVFNSQQKPNVWQKE